MMKRTTITCFIVALGLGLAASACQNKDDLKPGESRTTAATVTANRASASVEPPPLPNVTTDESMKDGGAAGTSTGWSGTGIESPKSSPPKSGGGNQPAQQQGGPVDLSRPAANPDLRLDSKSPPQTSPTQRLPSRDMDRAPQQQDRSRTPDPQGRPLNTNPVNQGSITPGSGPQGGPGQSSSGGVGNTGGGGVSGGSGTGGAGGSGAGGSGAGGGGF